MTDPVFFEPFAFASLRGEVAAADRAAELGQSRYGPYRDQRRCRARRRWRRKARYSWNRSVRPGSVATIPAAALLCPPGLQLDILPRHRRSFLRSASRRPLHRSPVCCFRRPVTPVAMTGETGISPAAHVAPDAQLEEERHRSKRERWSAPVCRHRARLRSSPRMQ